VHKRALNEILAGYRLKVGGTHGINHWSRVLANGRRLTPLTGADPVVVDLFAIFHDSRRENEGRDPGHGARGGKLAQQFRRQGLIDLTHVQLELLVYACAHHTSGKTEADVTVQTCWDADRLDLGRVGITPDPAKLCTDAARDPDMIAWADKRAWDEWRSFALDEWLKA
jgi:uncharacterized protein